MRLPKRLPKKRIDNIKDPEKRLWHLFSYYSDNESYRKCKQQLGGIIDIVSGLQYHYNQHNLHEKKVDRCQFYGWASHEAIAYINRIGQVYYFVKSDWFNAYIPQSDLPSLIPTVLALVPLRNKISAHRQQDYPYKDDCKSLGFHKFGLKSRLGGKIANSNALRGNKEEETGIILWSDVKKSFIGMQIQYSFPTKQRDKLLDNCPRIDGFEYLGGENNIIFFQPSIHHQIIMDQIFIIIEKFLQKNENQL